MTDGPWAIRLLGLVDGTATACDNRWVVEYDPTRAGTSPEGVPMRAHLTVTDDRSQARRFADPADLYAYLMTTTGRPRPDGGIDRPLLAFHLMIDRADDDG